METVKQVLAERRGEILSIYENMIRHESWSREPDNVVAVEKYFIGQLEQEGFACRLAEVGTNAPALIAELGMDRPGKPVVLGGHIDTIHPKGSFGADPFQVKDGIAYGPGVFDMKGGLVIALAVVKALNAAGFSSHPIKFIVSGDEEINHTGSTCAQVFEEESRGALCAFNMEGTDRANLVCTGRKGNIRYSVKVTGRSAHCSIADTPGVVSAIREMSAKVLDWHNITDWSVGTSVNVGLISGGTAANTVPEHCQAEIDIRFTTEAQMRAAVEKFKAVCEKSYFEGTKTEYEYLCIMDVYETTPRETALFQHLKDACAKHGLEEMETHYRPGGSDAAYFGRAGVPTLCCGGISGGEGHTLREYAQVESIFTRAMQLAAAILEIGSFNG